MKKIILILLVIIVAIGVTGQSTKYRNVTRITGTANQITASSGTGPVTLSLPQSIGTSSTVQFGSVGIGGAASYPLQVVDTVSTNGNTLYSFRGRAFNTSSTNAAHYMQAQSYSVIARPAVSTTNSGYTCGAYSEAYLDAGAAGTMATLQGGVYKAYIDSTATSTAAVTTAVGLEGSVFNNKAGTTIGTGIAVRGDSTSSGGVITNAYDFYGVNSSAKNYLAGGVTFDTTITAGGTTGAQTINKAAFTVNFAAAATSLVVTNSKVTTSSIPICTVQANDSTLKSVAAVPGSGSVTLYANAAATGETKVGCVIH